MASLNSQPTGSQMCTLNIFVHIQPFYCNLKAGLFDLPSSLASPGLVIKAIVGVGMEPLDARPWFPFSLPLTHIVCLLAFF